MKKLITLITIGAMVAACNSDQEEVQPDLIKSADDAQTLKEITGDEGRTRSCLVAYYPFRGNANDYSVYGNHGTVLGPVLTSDRHGNSKQAYYFDGNDDAIEAPDQPQLHLQNSFTISAWVNPRTIKSQKIITKGSHVNGTYAAPYALGLSGTHDVVFQVHPNAVYNELRYSGYPVGNWYMLTATYNDGAVGIYINDQLVAIDKVDKGSFNYNRNPLIIGTRLQLPSSTFVGKIDEVRLYCDALSPQEVADLYNATK